MLDPREQAKGGFRAQVERANERQQTRRMAADDTPALAPATAPQADGSDEAPFAPTSVHAGEVRP